MKEYIQVFTTVGSMSNAEKISEILVEAKLAGCVQVVGPISSTYWWEGSVEVGEEWLLLIKTLKSMYLAVEEKIKQIHSYEVPEIIYTEISGGNKDYLSWLGQELQSG